MENDWSKKKVLVTGAGGFIGSHLVEELVKKQAHVRALIRYNSVGSFGWLDEIPSPVLQAVEVVQGDLRDFDSVARAVRGVDRVFHLGALISIPFSYLSPTETQEINVTGTQNILNACREFQVERLMHTSTSEVYGTAVYAPIDEKHPYQAQSPYAATKIAADQLALSYFRTYDLPVVVVRPFNTYGPRQSARAVIPTILVQLQSKNHLKLGSLHPTRDFTFVSDTVSGMIASMDAGSHCLGDVYNLGTSSEVSIGELAKLAVEVVGWGNAPEEERQRVRPKKSEVERLLSENRKAREAFQWTPKISLEEGLRVTSGWIQEHLDRYRRAQKSYVV